MEILCEASCRQENRSINPFLTDPFYQDMKCLREFGVAIGHRAFSDMTDHHFYIYLFFINL